MTENNSFTQADLVAALTNGASQLLKQLTEDNSEINQAEIQRRVNTLVQLASVSAPPNYQYKLELVAL